MKVTLILAASIAMAMAVPARTLAGTQEREANVRFPPVISSLLGGKILENVKINEEKLMAATDKAPTKTEGKQIEVPKTVPAEEKTEADGKEPAEAGEKRTKMVATLPADENGSPQSEMKKPTKMGEEVAEKTKDSKTEVGTDEDDEDEHEEEDGHGHPEEKSSDEEDDEESDDEEDLTPEEKQEQHCTDLIGAYVDGVWQGAEEKHDLPKILEKFGGPPGKVNATWTEKEDAPVKEEDLEERPLPDADQKYWIYNYKDTDEKTFSRSEHAVRRFSGTPKAFMEIRGEVIFTPENFCGKARKAHYTVDDHGFTSEVSREYCQLGNTVTCESPSQCLGRPGGSRVCVAPLDHPLRRASSLIGL